MNGYYAKLIELLKAHGYWYDRPAKGSHELWTNGKRATTVPRNCQSRHTANSILKQAGIDAKV